jgi:hypothetical protein
MRFIFQKYNGKNKYTCPSCGHPKCFKRYFDTFSNQIVSNEVGRCDRENNCSYHFTPAQFKKNGGKYPESLNEKYKLPTPPVFIDEKYILEFNFYDQKENLTRWISNSVKTNTLEIFQKYKLGCIDYFGQKSLIFWQIDSNNKIHFGKIMAYSLNGHRLKNHEGKGYVSSFHKYLLNQKLIAENYEVETCFFGQHLLPLENKTVAIVESEKTALFCACLYPNYTWIATGTINGLSIKSLRSLQNKDIILMPDFGKGVELWDKKIPLIQKYSQKTVKISEYILKNNIVDNYGKDLIDLL